MDDLLKHLQTNFYDMFHNIVENKQKSFNELEIEVINDFLNEREKHFDTNSRI